MIKTIYDKRQCLLIYFLMHRNVFLCKEEQNHLTALNNTYIPYLTRSSSIVIEESIGGTIYEQLHFFPAGLKNMYHEVQYNLEKIIDKG